MEMNTHEKSCSTVSDPGLPELCGVMSPYPTVATVATM